MSYAPPTSLMDTVGEGIPSWSFKDKPLGTTYSGTVVSMDWKQQTDYDTGVELWWNPGERKPSTTKAEGAKPVWQYVVTLDTDERTGPEDDGRRRDFVQLGKYGTEKLAAAVGKAGLSDLVPGCGYKKRLVDEEPASNPRFNARKVYAWQVTPPAASLNDFDGPASAPASAPAPAVEDF